MRFFKTLEFGRKEICEKHIVTHHKKGKLNIKTFPFVLAIAHVTECST